MPTAQYKYDEKKLNGNRKHIELTIMAIMEKPKVAIISTNPLYASSSSPC